MVDLIHTWLRGGCSTAAIGRIFEGLVPRDFIESSRDDFTPLFSAVQRHHGLSQTQRRTQAPGVQETSNSGGRLCRYRRYCKFLIVLESVDE